MNPFNEKSKDRKRQKPWYKQILGGRETPVVFCYLGYASDTNVFAYARVLEDHRVYPSPTISKWTNFIDSMLRFKSDEIPGAVVQVDFYDLAVKLHADKEGYLHLDHTYEGPMDHQSAVHPIQYTIKELPPRYEMPERVQFTGKVMIPPSRSTFGVITDIDDTIIHTDVLSKIRVAYNTLLIHSGYRKAVKDAATWFEMMHNGASGDAGNPFFYVSNSPWNLYHYLQDFLKQNEFPEGPILLRDFGWSNATLPKGSKSHKHYQIQKILRSFPRLPFILVGDASEKDPEIYHYFKSRYPERIPAVFLRGIPKKEKIIRKWKQEVKDPHIHIVPNYRVAADISRAYIDNI